MWAGVGDIVGKTIAVLRRMTAFNPRFLHLPTQHAVRIAAMFCKRPVNAIWTTTV